MEACPIALGCDSRHSHPEACFPLPPCRHLKETFKDSSRLVPKQDFTGDPQQANWISNYHHIAPYAKIDPRHHRLLLRTRREMVKTQSGGGFGATISSTRWSKYGTFIAKIQSGSTGPGIVTAFLLSNPVRGEEISFELTGKDPKKVVTNYYRRIPAANADHPSQHQQPFQAHASPQAYSRLESHEEIHDLKRDSTQHELVYKIEWNEKHIRWSVDGKVIRTVFGKDVASQGGLPEDAMQLQLTIWDAGYTPEASAWAGGRTDYGGDNLKEYVATVNWIEVRCKNSKEGRKPWPGSVASKRLQLARDQAAKRSSKGRGYGDAETGLFAAIIRFIETVTLSLFKWVFMFMAVVCGAAYFAPPTPKVVASTVAGTSTLPLADKSKEDTDVSKR
ncbi:concanavalin A-like lectin/glucanase domain-containing protein [Mortierella sp. GBAus27b]|nr:hypothetical protein BGX31_002742 [Mortierella sp. GBA43]KAI8363108.1 concanavalin A-like lectin/glucanase domain-containing protein [Mortierella sp. GBAus27b]